MNRFFVVARTLGVCAGLLGVHAAQSEVVIDLSGGTGWTAAVPGQVAAPVFVPYGNSETTTLDPNHMMWSCTGTPAECAAQAARGAGPEEVIFRRAFVLPAGANDILGLIAFAADDYLEVSVNGHFIFNAVLSGNQDLQKQPVPINMWFDGRDILPSGNLLNCMGLCEVENVLVDGVNEIVVRAMDGFALEPGQVCAGTVSGRPGVEIPVPGGYTFCKIDNSGEFLRDYEYLFAAGSIRYTPEPATLALAGLASLLAAGASRRRPRVRG